MPWDVTGQRHSSEQVLLHIFFIRRRPKLLTNDCVKINEGTAVDHSHSPFCVAGMPLFSNFKTLRC